jgi:serine protease AprX
MTRMRLISLSIAAICSILIGYSYQSLSFATKLAPNVANFVQSQSKNVTNFPILIVLKEQGDLLGVEDIQSKEAKGAFVYEQLRQVALKTQNPLVSFLKNQNFSFRQFYISNMISVAGATRELIQNLAARPDVARIVGDVPVTQQWLPVQAELLKKDDASVEDNITSTGAPRVWSELKITGHGITVAGQDTGVQWDHPALKNNYRGFSEGKADHSYNWHDSVHKSDTSDSNPCGYDIGAPCDDDKHGTHTMGTMVGDDGGDNKIGMAPGANWMACRNMDQGTGRPTSYIECFEFFLAPYTQGGNPLTDGVPSKAPHVINNSWGCPTSEGCEGTEMIPILQALNKAGIFVVASAGNDGPSCSTIDTQPAQLSGLTLTVGAHDHRDGSIAAFSSRGPSRLDGGIGPDVTAPGVDIRSSVPGNSYAGGWSGTSMAGPHVVGLVALIWSGKPQLIGHIKETMDLIRKTATPVTVDETCGGVGGSQVPNNTFGYGRIDAYKALTN